MRKLTTFALTLKGLHDRTINVTARTTGGRVLAGSAEGGTVPSTGLPYADRYHYLLADGEEVVSNRYGQADKWRPLLKAINADRLAGGGTVGSASVPALGIGIDYDRLARTLSMLRPIYGDLHMQPHNYSEFTRQIERDRSMAALTGVNHG